MSFFISDAMAEGAAAAPSTGDALMGMLPLVLIFLVFYFLLIRPQVKRAKEHKKLVEAVTTGDEVLTSGGIVGKVKDVDENFITIEIANNLSIKVQRQYVSSQVPKGTYQP